jgi:predicted aspartyl protease
MPSPKAKRPKLGADAWVECIFLDVVSYSTRRTDSQTAIIKALNRIVKDSIRPYRLRPDQRIFIPTGDGMCVALLNVGDPYDIQMQIALGILKGLEKHNSGRTAEDQLRFEVRIGINMNRDNVVIDINENPNVAGKGINDTSRIMGKADGGQILVGEAVFNNLKERGKYASAAAFRPYLADVKHGLLLKVYQFIGGDHSYLNVNIPGAFKPTVGVARRGQASIWSPRDLRTRGLKMRVEIGPSEVEVRSAKLAGLELKKPLAVTALIDTGASVTVINPQVAATCGLRQVGQAAISATGLVSQMPEYAGAIRFPGSELRGFDPVKFIACPLPGADFSCLIGRDIMERWRMVYDGRTGEVKIEE